MITDSRGDRTTSKEAAQEMLMEGIAQVLGYWVSNYKEQYAKMTPREREKFTEQLQKQGDRVAKMFHFDGAWSA